MKRTATGFGVILLLASAAMANQVQVGSSSYRYGQYQTGVGGEFTLTPTTNWLDLSHYAEGAKNVGGISGSFQTFCVEGGEYIYPYPSIADAIIQDNAVGGGVGGAGDPISVGTGWLYGQFASNTWGSGLSYNYRSNRNISALLLQQAIWGLEGEENIAYSTANPYMYAVANQFGGWSNAQADGGWQYGVYALHLTPANNNADSFQDQIYYSGAPIPEPTSLLLLGAGLAGLALAAKRRRK